MAPCFSKKPTAPLPNGKAYIQYSFMRELKNNLVSRVRAVIARLSLFFKVDMAYVASGAFWGNVNYLFITLVAFVTSILFADLLTKDQYGTYQYVLSIAGLISGLTLTGMNTAVTRAVARGHEGELRRSVKFQILAGILPSAVALGVGVWYFFHNHTSISVSFLWVALVLPAANALNTWAAFAGGKKLWRLGTYFGFANTFISYIGVILMLVFTRDFVWIALGNFGFGFLGNYIMYRMTIKQFKPNNEIEKGTLSYGTHLSIMGMPGVISSQLDALLVFHFVGPAALAVYTFATLIPEKIQGGLKFVSNVALPKFAEKDEDSVKRFLVKRLPMIFIILGLIAGAYALIAPFIFHIFFPAYSASIPFTQVYALSFFSVAGGLVQTGLTSQQKTKALYISNLILPALQAALLVVLMYFYGVWGILWAQIALDILQAPIQLAFLGRKT